jgi:3-oxoacyl-[acyl-carrier protein] reductase
MTAPRVIVTGAASGIGLATARAFAKSGARVIGLDIAHLPADILGIHVDVSDAASVDVAVHQACTQLGGLDCLINCAGVEYEAPLAALDIAALDRILVARAALPFIADGGCIINLASELAYLGRANASGYCATKGGILSLTRSWARELGPRIRVNAVAPGPIDTPLLNFAGMSAALKDVETGNPLGRIGRPEEVAAVIQFLASPAASFITGQCYSADGGAAMH